jgi:hypothetical protein
VIPSGHPADKVAPGGLPDVKVRRAIRDLARQAREEDLKAEKQARRRVPRRAVSILIRVGLVLIATQIGLFAYLYTTAQLEQQGDQATEKAAATNCETVRHRTYWKVVAYMRDEGHPPASFEQLLGKYIDKLPTDPVTGNELLYSTDGAQRFELQCPGSVR